MLKNIFFLIILSVFFSAESFAQQSSGGGSARHIALGGGPMNPYLRDIMRAHTNPAQLAADSNAVWGDLGYLAVDAPNGGSRYQYLGTALTITDQIHAGLILNKRESPLYTLDPATPSLDPIDELNGYTGAILGFGGQFGRPLSPFELLASYHLASIDFGGSISYGGWKSERSPGGPTLTARTWRMKAGFIAPRLNNSLTLDAAVLVGLNSVDGTIITSGQDSKLSMDGGTEIGIDVHTDYIVDNRWTVLPVLRWYSFSWGMNQVRNGIPSSPNPASEYSHDQYELGVGLNFRTENVLVAGGLSYQQTILISDYKTSGSASKTTTTTTDLPKINFGAEIRLASWVSARIGYFDRIASTESVVETPAGKTTTTTTSELPWYGDPNGLSAAQQRITIGVGVSVAGLCLDGTMGEGYFLNGPWPLSGMAQQMFGVLSMNYRF